MTRFAAGKLESRLLKALIAIVALVETGLLAAFAVFASSGDSLGIARAMLFGLAVPYVLTTAPGVILMARGRLLIAAVLVGLSVPLIWLVWFLA